MELSQPSLRYHVGELGSFVHRLSAVEQPTASLAYQAQVYCGLRPGPTRVMLPSRQDDGNIRTPALACVVARGVVVVVSGCGSLLCTTVCPPARLLERFRFDAVSGDLRTDTPPIGLYATTLQLLVAQVHAASAGTALVLSSISDSPVHCTAFNGSSCWEKPQWAVSHQSCTLTHRHPSSHLTWQRALDRFG